MIPYCEVQFLISVAETKRNQEKASHLVAIVLATVGLALAVGALAEQLGEDVDRNAGNKAGTAVLGLLVRAVADGVAAARGGSSSGHGSSQNRDDGCELHLDGGGGFT